MAIKRSNLFYSGQRLDIPQFRTIESAAQADSDTAWGSLFAGRKALIVKGFTLSVTPSIIGAPAENLVLNTAGGAVYHYNASAAGTFLEVDENQSPETLNATNTRVKGGFISNTTNYISIDLVRVTDSNSVDTLQFIDPSTDTQFARDLPIARIFDYRVMISNVPFGNQSNACPVAKVVTDTNNNVVSVTDARALCYRLGSGGTLPSATNTYTWNTLSGLRTENPLTTTTGSASPFLGTDKSISSFSDWSEAVMTRLWEVGGGEHWYSATTDKNIRMALDTATAPMTDNFEFNGTQIRWSGIKITFDNSTGTYNTVTNQTTYQNFADGYALYVDLDRSSNATLTAAIAPLATLGMSSIPGARYILAWRLGSKAYARDYTYWIGRAFPAPSVASTTVEGIVYTVNDPGTNNLASSAFTDPVVPIIYNDNSSTELYLNVIAGGLTRGEGLSGINNAATINIARGGLDNKVTIGSYIDPNSGTAIPGSNNLSNYVHIYTRKILLMSGASSGTSMGSIYPIEIDSEDNKRALIIGGTNLYSTTVDGGVAIFGLRSTTTQVGATGTVTIGHATNTTGTTVQANGSITVQALSGNTNIDATGNVRIGLTNASQTQIGKSSGSSRTTIQGNGSTNPELIVKTNNVGKSSSPILRVQDSTNTNMFDVTGEGNARVATNFQYLNTPSYRSICTASDMITATGNVKFPHSTAYTLSNSGSTYITWDAAGYYRGPYWYVSSGVTMALTGRLRVPAYATLNSLEILCANDTTGTNSAFQFFSWFDTYEGTSTVTAFPYAGGSAGTSLSSGFNRTYLTTTANSSGSPLYVDTVQVSALPADTNAPFWIVSGTNGLTMNGAVPTNSAENYINFVIFRQAPLTAIIKIFAVAITYHLTNVAPTL